MLNELCKSDAINRTQFNLYPLTVLESLRVSHNLNATEWRLVGDYQKALWRSRLLKRAEHSPTGDTCPPFEFDNLDWRNIFQLEAIVEFYANYDEPWAAGATPRHTSDPSYITIDFLDSAGTAAMVVGNVVTLNENPDLTKVQVNHDTIFLENDTARASRTYRITAVDHVTHTVTLDAFPLLNGPTSAWKINQQPVIVVIDPFGGRISGKHATVAATNVVKLDAATPAIKKLNANFDTLYLPSDMARPTRTYRITAVDHTTHTVTLDGQPVLDSGISTWHIPAGVSGDLPPLTYNLGPGGKRGYDHYDGIIFIIKNGAVKGRFRASSYTSRNYAAGSQLLSSIRGNKSYDLSSFCSGRASLNYNFKITDQGATYDGVREARFYFSTPVTPDNALPDTAPDIDGKTFIRLHHGYLNQPDGGIGSAGCLVSPVFTDFRTRMIELYQEDYRAIHNSNDPEIQKVWGINHEQSQTLWNNSSNRTGNAENQLTRSNWNNKLKATLWLIRPDERPLP